MINFGNIQAAAVKSIYKDKEKGRPQEYIVWGEKNGIVPISYQNSVIFFVPAENFLLKSPEDNKTLEKFIEDLTDIKEEHKLIDTRTIKVFEAKVNTYKTKEYEVNTYKTVEDEEIHLRSDYVKMFGKDAKFYDGKKGFIYVKEFGRWVGCLGLYKVR